MTTTRAGGYAGFFSNDSAVSIDVATGTIFIHNQTTPIGSRYLGGGLWIAQVPTDPDVRMVLVIPDITLLSAQAAILGIFYGDAHITIGAGGVFTSGELVGQTLPMVEQTIIRGSGIGGFDSRLPTPFRTVPAFRFTKPASTRTNILALAFQINTWTGGGPLIDANAHIQAVLNSVTIIH